MGEHKVRPYRRNGAWQGVRPSWCLVEGTGIMVPGREYGHRGTW